MRIAPGCLAASAALVLAETAGADFVSIAATHRDVVTTGGVELTVYRLYATFDGAADQVSGVGGSPLFPQTLDSGGSGFFQQTLLGGHQNLPATAAAIASVPDMAHDSFVTIGVPAGYAPPANLAELSEHFYENTFNPPGTGFSTVVVINDDAGWFMLPTLPETVVRPFPPPDTPAPEGDGAYDGVLGAGGPHGVLIAQLAVGRGNALTGDLGLLSVLEDGTPRVLSGLPISFEACPADLDGSGDVGFGDVLAVIGAWGPCPAPCAADLDGSGDVGFGDVLAVIGAWGPC